MTERPDADLRYAVVTSTRTGYAGRFAEIAARLSEPGARFVAVVYCHGRQSPESRWRTLSRKFRKARSIGILGTLNGFRMRRWFGKELSARLGNPDIFSICRQHAIPMIEIEHFTDDGAFEKLRSLDLDVAISMGNGFIPERFFSTPRFGMINIHHEVLPEYRGAQTALWQIYNGSRHTGFTIHEITNRLDAGRILARETVPIEVRSSLCETVVATSAIVQLRSIDRLLEVLQDFRSYLANARPNVGGRLYTTPSTRALIRIYRNFWRLRRNAGHMAVTA